MNDASGKSGITTSQLLSMIKKSEQFSDIAEVYHDITETPVFCHYLYDIMEKHRFSAKDIISSSGIERSYFYHILSGQKMPGRNMILRISLCMRATLTETNQLLRLSNQGVLYAKVRRDAAIIFAIEKKCTMQQTNDLLLSIDEAPLYREGSS